MPLKYLIVAGLVPCLACALSKPTIECSFTRAASTCDTCESLADAWGLSVESLKQLNPGITCPGLDTSKSYCVIGTVNDDVPSTTLTTTMSMTTTSKASDPTTTSSTASAPTNSPTMPDCTNLWLDYYVCVHVPGATTTTPAAPDPTNDPSGPTPQLPGIVEDCKSFHLVKDGGNCYSISSDAGITLAQLRQWNTEIDAACNNLWLGYYVCIGV
ncbi:hypothetical protein AbraIFM66950_006577 [Aspergillus brasiliensis]|nr:hypothetical protein AbraIFM66950_006577 [Aspergillus brasiliensis]